MNTKYEIHKLFAEKFTQFMIANNLSKLSAQELVDVGKEINNLIDNGQVKFTAQYILKLLAKFNITDVHNKGSGSWRSRYWFHTPLCSETLKLNSKI